MWQQILANYGVFLLEVITVVVAIVVVIGYASSASKKTKNKEAKGEIHVSDLSKEYKDTQSKLEDFFLSDEEKNKKDSKKIGDEDPKESKPRLFVLDFKGGAEAKEVDALRKEITAVLSLAQAEDQVLVRLESPGGVVDGYGLGASQLERIKAAGIPLTVAVDKVAASGGYMMAVVADQILAAPFAYIGSIGVVSEQVNIHRLLKKNDIDVDIMTAGEYKRTMTLMGENTDKGRQKYQETLDNMHGLFKDHVQAHRPDLDMDQVATGEFWLGRQALDLGLVDQLSTSDDFVLEAMKTRQVVKLAYKTKEKLAQKLALSIGASLKAALGLLPGNAIR